MVPMQKVSHGSGFPHIGVARYSPCASSHWTDSKGLGASSCSIKSPLGMKNTTQPYFWCPTAARGSTAVGASPFRGRLCQKMETKIQRGALTAEASGESSWWPTVHVWLPGEHDSENEHHWIEAAGGMVLVVVCVYQWLWPMPQGWSVKLANWSRL